MVLLILLIVDVYTCSEELTHYFLELPEVSGHYLLSERFSQDPVENYFGHQRTASGYNQNP